MWIKRADNYAVDGSFDVNGKLSINYDPGRGSSVVDFNVHRSFNIIEEDRGFGPHRGLLLNSDVGGNAWGVAYRRTQLVKFGGDSKTTTFFHDVECKENFDVDGSKNFNIKHPLFDDAKKRLIHSSVESPYVGIQYTGMVKLKEGKGKVDLDVEFGMTKGTFSAFAKKIRRMTTNESSSTPVWSKMNEQDGILEIFTDQDDCEDEIFWMVTAERNDEKIKQSKYTDNNGFLVPEQELQKNENE